MGLWDIRWKNKANLETDQMCWWNKRESRVIPWFWLGQPLGGGVVYTKKGTQEESGDFCGVR